MFMVLCILVLLAWDFKDVISTSMPRAAKTLERPNPGVAVRKVFYLTKPGDGSAAATAAAAAAESRRPKKFLIWLSWLMKQLQADSPIFCDLIK